MEKTKKHDFRFSPDKRRTVSMARLISALVGTAVATSILHLVYDQNIPPREIIGSQAFAHDLINDIWDLGKLQIGQKVENLVDVRTGEFISGDDATRIVDVVTAQDSRGNERVVIRGDQIIDGQNLMITFAQFFDRESDDDESNNKLKPRLLYIETSERGYENLKPIGVTRDDGSVEAVPNRYPQIASSDPGVSTEDSERKRFLFVFPPSKQTHEQPASQDPKPFLIEVGNWFLVNNLADGAQQITLLEQAVGSKKNWLITKYVVTPQGELLPAQKIDLSSDYWSGNPVELLSSSGEPQNIALYESLAGSEYILDSHDVSLQPTRGFDSSQDEIAVLMVEHIVLYRADGSLVDTYLQSVLQLSYQDGSGSIKLNQLPVIRSEHGALEIIGYLSDGTLVTGQRISVQDPRSYQIGINYYNKIILNQGGVSAGPPLTHEIPLPPTTIQIEVKGFDIAAITPTGQKWILGYDYSHDPLGNGQEPYKLDAKEWPRYWHHLGKEASRRAGSSPTDKVSARDGRARQRSFERDAQSSYKTYGNKTIGGT